MYTLVRGRGDTEMASYSYYLHEFEATFSMFTGWEQMRYIFKKNSRGENLATQFS
jgi:hypothetical protein